MTRLADRTRLLESFIGYVIDLVQQRAIESQQPPLRFQEEVDRFLTIIETKEKGDADWEGWNDSFRKVCGKLSSSAVEGISIPPSESNGNQPKTGLKRSRRSSSDASRLNPMDGDVLASTMTTMDYSIYSPSNHFLTGQFGSQQDARNAYEASIVGEDMSMHPFLESTDDLANRIQLAANASSSAITPLSLPRPQQTNRQQSSIKNLGSGFESISAIRSFMSREESEFLRNPFDDDSEYMDMGPSGMTRGGPTGGKGVTFVDTPLMSIRGTSAELDRTELSREKQRTEVEDGPDDMQDHIEEPEYSATGEEMIHQATEGPSTAIDRQPYDLNYTSGFWRTADAEDPTRSPFFRASGLTTAPTPKIQLPPKDVQNHCIETYLKFVHPQFPLLDEAQLRSYASQNGSQGSTPKPSFVPTSRILMLSLCAYSACFSPTLGGAASSVTALGLDNASAGGILADIWYEEARSMLMSSTLRRRCGLDTIQAVVLMAMREHGKAQDFQAWLLLGELSRRFAVL
jgi:hypothetical protein